MGVSGSGKSTLAQALARVMDLDFVEGDDLHSPANIEKMHHGVPLDDQDRTPWLAAIAQRLADSQRSEHGVVISCSALKVAYRNALRVDPCVRFIFLDVDRAEIEQRLARREGHFMPAALAGSQFETLERPMADEKDVLTLTARLAPNEQLRQIRAFLA